MKKIYDHNLINKYITHSRYCEILHSLEIDFFLINYEKGELVDSPFLHEPLFQIIVGGVTHIYFIREDGTRYSLSNGTVDYLLGDMDIFYPKNNNIYAEAAENLMCIAFSIDQYKDHLLSNCRFLELICNSLAAKIGTMTTIDAAPASLTDRLLSYMRYKCNDGIMKGVEHTAFSLHCSSRQLQRILNQCEKDGLITKLGKGSYQLNQ